jgi:hypothetical protein
MKITKYNNCTQAKIKNRRVSVYTKEKNIAIEFKQLSELELVNEPRAVHKNIGDKIVVTGVMITRESAIALLNCLYNELDK